MILTERFVENVSDFPKMLTITVVKYWRNLAIMSAGIEVSEMEYMGKTEKYSEMLLAYNRKVNLLTNRKNANYEQNADLVMPAGITAEHFAYKLCSLNDKEQDRRKSGENLVNGKWLWEDCFQVLKKDCGNETLEIFYDICPDGKFKSGASLKALILELRSRLYAANRSVVVEEDSSSSSSVVVEETTSVVSSSDISALRAAEMLGDQYVDDPAAAEG